MTSAPPVRKTPPAARAPRVRRIGLYLPNVRDNTALGVTVMTSILSWLEENPGFELARVNGFPFLSLAEVTRAKVHGLLCAPTSTRDVHDIYALKVPAVSVADFAAADDFPFVHEDNYQIGQLAAEYLVQRGFRSFGFVGLGDAMFSKRRRQGFRDGLKAAGGFETYSFEALGMQHGWERDYQLLEPWILQLPLPVAVFANTDHIGRLVTEICRENGLGVPSDVAVIGVGNKELECTMSSPPLTSIALDMKRETLLALRMLGTLMAGRKLENAEILVPPREIVTRKSTEIYMFADAKIGAIIEYLRRHATEGITIDDVLRKFPMSRRSLEMTCKKILGHPPYKEIQRIQLTEAKKLLRETKHGISEIADRTGFNDVNHLGRIFRMKIGVTPGEYRAREQNGLR